MSATSELGLIDPQIPIFDDSGAFAQYLAAHEIVESYEKLMKTCVQAKGRIEAYLEQLSRYDAREIRRIQSFQQLSESVGVGCLKRGCMSRLGASQIRAKIKPFLDPRYTKVHGRPIYRDVAANAGLAVREFDLKEDAWRAIWNLYVRLDHLLSSRAAKVVESKKDSYIMAVTSR